MFTAIYIHPNTNDDWTDTGESPFSGYHLAAGQKGFVLGTSNICSATEYVFVPSKLADIQDIQRDVDVFRKSRTRLLEGRPQITGVGGLSKSGDFVFVLENVTDTVDEFGLLGRLVIATMRLNSNNIGSIFDEDVIFKGRIFDMTPSKKGLSFTVRSKLQMLKDSVVGAPLSNADNNYAKIDPIIYGDLTDKEAYAPLKYAGEDISLGLSVGSRVIKELSDLVVFDEGAEEGYSSAEKVTVNGQVLAKSLDNREFVYSKLDRNPQDTTLYVFDPPIIAFKTDDTISDLEPRESMYEDSLGQAYVFVEEKEGYYLFSAPDTETYTAPPKSGILTKIDLGYSGPDTISFTWFSDILPSKLDLMDEIYQNSAEEYVEAKPKPSILTTSTEDELIFIKYSEHDYVTEYGYYQGTRLYVERGYLGTDPVSILDGEELYIYDRSKSTRSWLFKHKISPVGVNKVGSVGYLGSSSSSSDIITFDNELFSISKLNDLLRDPNSITSSDFFEVSFVHPELSEADFAYLIDLEFPKISLNAKIINIFIGGGYTGQTPEHGSTAPDTGYINGSVGWLVGGNPLQLSTLYMDNIESDYTFQGIFCSNFTGAFVKSMNASQPYAVFSKYPGTALGGVAINAMATSMFFNTILAIGAKTADEETFDLKIKDPALLQDDRYFGAPIQTFDDLGSQRICLAFRVRSDGTASYLNGKQLSFRVWAPHFIVHFAVDPTKTKIWWRGKGRVDDSNDLIESPAAVTLDILKSELGVTDAEINWDTFNAALASRVDWKMAFSLHDQPIKFDSLMQKICEQSGLVMGEDLQGRITLTSITPPTSSSGLRSIDTLLLDEGANLADWEEEFSAIDTLFTDLITYYQHNDLSDKYRNAIEKNEVTGLEALLLKAKNILDEDRPVALNLDLIRDYSTAVRLANLAGVYNSLPIRFITMRLPLEYKDYRQGEWVTINSPHVPRTLGKIYNIVETTIQPGYLETDPYVKIKVFEVPDSLSDDIIQEVPSAPLSQAWQESDDGDEINETFSLA